MSKQRDGQRYRYTLAHDLLATLRCLWDAHVRESKVWAKIKRDAP